VKILGTGELVTFESPIRVLDLKTKIYDIKGIPPKLQNLQTLDGKTLKNKDIIPDEAKLYLVNSLKGGMGAGLGCGCCGSGGSCGCHLCTIV
jgi:hypothetical protein